MAVAQRLTAAAATTSDARPRDRAVAMIGQALLLLPLLVFATLIPLLNATDPDYWWHLRTGQLIAETGTVPRVDDYSFTMTGQPWISHEWLTDLLIFVLGRGIGYVGVAALFGLVGALTLGLIYLTCRARGGAPVTATLLCAWAILLMQPSINARPQMLTMLLLALGAYVLTRARDGATRALWALPPLMALWVNLHGGYLIGLVLLGLAVVGAGAERFLGHRDRPILPLIATTLLAALASFLTPHGLDALRYPLSYIGRENASLQFVAEWKSPDFHQILFFPFAASLILLLALGLAGRPLRPTDLLWGVTIAFMALQSVRHIPLYAIVATPLLAARLGTLPWERFVPRAHRRDLIRFGLGVLAVLVPLSLTSALWGLSGGPGGARQFGRAPSTVGYPSGAVAYLRDAAPHRAAVQRMALGRLSDRGIVSGAAGLHRRARRPVRRRAGHALPRRRAGASRLARDTGRLADRPGAGRARRPARPRPPRRPVLAGTLHRRRGTPLRPALTGGKITAETQSAQRTAETKRGDERGERRGRSARRREREKFIIPLPNALFRSAPPR